MAQREGLRFVATSKLHSPGTYHTSDGPRTPHRSVPLQLDVTVRTGSPCTACTKGLPALVTIRYSVLKSVTFPQYIETASFRTPSSSLFTTNRPIIWHNKAGSELCHKEILYVHIMLMCVFSTILNIAEIKR